MLWPSPRGGLVHRLVGERAGARDDADLPGLWMWPGMMPILHSPGVMMPGQFGPIRRDVRMPFSAFFTAHHVEDRNAFGDADDERMPASAASRIASAANGGGTKIMRRVGAGLFDRLLRPC